MINPLTFSLTLIIAALCGFQDPPSTKVKAGEGPGHRFGSEQSLPKKKGVVRLASYNMLNLFDQEDDPKLSGKQDDLPMATSDDRCKAMAKAIAELDADVLCLQEIESEQALKWYRDTYLKGQGYDHIATLDAGYYRGVEQSVLSRYPIAAVKNWTDEDISDMQALKKGGQDAGWSDCEDDQGQEFQRSPLMVDVSIPGRKGADPYVLTVIVVHHKASRGFDCQRESEALQIVDLLEQRMEKEPELNAVVIGDFNATPFAKSVKVYTDAGFENAYGYRWKTEGNTRDLFRTHESNRAIDFIMLHPNAWKEAVPGTFQVVGTLNPGTNYNWRTDEPPSGYAADHYPLSIDLVPVDK